MAHPYPLETPGHPGGLSVHDRRENKASQSPTGVSLGRANVLWFTTTISEFIAAATKLHEAMEILRRLARKRQEEIP